MVPVLGGVVVPPVLGEGAELVVGGGEAGFVVEFLVDGECFVVPVLGGVVVPPVWARMPSWW